MGAGESWILVANFLDDSYMRNKIVYDLANDIGLQHSPDSEFVDLYLNGYYAGMYQLTEKVEAGKERVNIADLEEKNKRYNALTAEIETFDSEMARGVVLDKNPQDITGGCY